MTGPRGRPGGSRGQTAIDFAVGIGMFLVVLAFVIAFVPSMFEPFAGGTGDRLVLADRSADRLASDLLVAEPAVPAVLNDSCTADFFDADGSAAAGCRFTDDAASLKSVLGVGSSSITVNVTIAGPNGVRTVDGVRLAAGPAVPDRTDTVASRRSVRIEGEQDTLSVRLW